MTTDELPLWIVLLSGCLALLGAVLTLVGALGMLRLPTFYDRMHAPTLGTSWGAGGIMLGSIALFSYLGSRPIIHELLIGAFVTVTTPVTLMLLARAALYRDRAEARLDMKEGVVPEPAERADVQIS